MSITRGGQVAAMMGKTTTEGDWNQRRRLIPTAEFELTALGYPRYLENGIGV